MGGGSNPSSHHLSSSSCHGVWCRAPMFRHIRCRMGVVTIRDCSCLVGLGSIPTSTWPSLIANLFSYKSLAKDPAISPSSNRIGRSNNPNPIQLSFPLRTGRRIHHLFHVNESIRIHAAIRRRTLPPCSGSCHLASDSKILLPSCTVNACYRIV